MHTRIVSKVLAASCVAASLLVAAQANAAAGKDVYESTCAACHTSGVAGAPKLGDKAAWAPRIATGAGAMHASALKGKGVMPAKGGNAALSDADVQAAVDFMLGQSK
ncbi:MAG: c-type cytochrome [Telluria sp.]|nr:c-type cytochrome [Telluria sp.]